MWWGQADDWEENAVGCRACSAQDMWQVLTELHRKYFPTDFKGVLKLSDKVTTKRNHVIMNCIHHKMF